MTMLFSFPKRGYQVPLNSMYIEIVTNFAFTSDNFRQRL